MSTFTHFQGFSRLKWGCLVSSITFAYRHHWVHIRSLLSLSIPPVYIRWNARTHDKRKIIKSFLFPALLGTLLLGWLTENLSNLTEIVLSSEWGTQQKKLQGKGTELFSAETVSPVRTSSCYLPFIQSEDRNGKKLCTTEKPIKCTFCFLLLHI